MYLNDHFYKLVEAIERGSGALRNSTVGHVAIEHRSFGHRKSLTVQLDTVQLRIQKDAIQRDEHEKRTARNTRIKLYREMNREILILTRFCCLF